MSLSKKNPNLIVARTLLLEQLRKIDPIKIGEVTPNFVLIYDEVPYGETESKEVTEVNWEYALFDATDHEYQKLFDTLLKKKETPKKEKEAV